VAIKRRDALKRLSGLAPRVEEHLDWLNQERTGFPDDHWISEVSGWLEQMRDMLPHIGRRTGEEWTQRIEVYEEELRRLSNA
jgi:hypothetical protein